MIKIMTWNCQGCSTIKSMNQTKNTINLIKPDISILTETNLKKDQNLAQIKNHYSTGGKGKEARGKGVMAINHLEQIEIKNLEEKEGRILKFTAILNNMEINIICIYAPASYDRRKGWFSNNISLEDLEQADIVTGDFNINKYAKIKFKDGSSDKRKFTENETIEFLMMEVGLTEILPNSTTKTTFKDKLIDRTFLSTKMHQLNHSILERKKTLSNLANEHTKTKNKYEKETISNEITILQEEERIDRMIKSSINYINNKEIASNLLTSILKKRDSGSQIHRIKNPSNGEIETEQKEITDCFRKYYETLFKEKECDQETHTELLSTWNPPIDKKKLTEMEDRIEEYEVKLAIEKIAEGKSPGEDGITSSFYKIHQHKLIPILTELFNFFLNNEIPTEFKNGILTSIYKGKGDVLEISNRRPITLLNVDYKIYSKIINNRILKILPNIISKYQNGFIPGRLLHNNIIALDLAMEKSDRNTIITFYDFEKAFDSISHKALIRTLNHLKFPRKITNTILSMLTNTNIRVMVNGQLSESFRAGRGTKQGDPISPTLFAIVCECLSTSIRKDNTIIGIKLNQNNSMKIGQYADDTVTLASNIDDADKMDMKVIKFCQATAAKINDNKCVCITKNPKIKTKYKTIGAKEEERYLGFFFNRKGVISKVDDTVNKLENLTKCYSSVSSTLKGRITILKSYLLSQLTFQLYINEINDIKKLENVNANMLFKGDRWAISKERSRRDYEIGGLELWNMATRSNAQKAWIYEQYLREKDDQNCPPHMEVWKSEKENSLSRIHIKCWKAWKLLHHPRERITLKLNQVKPKYENKQKLKVIYRNMMDIKYKGWNKHQPTTGQKLIQKNINHPILPFREARSITTIKGRDLAWRYLLKALPKHHGENCHSCKEEESSMHIFFECKSIKQNIDSIYQKVCKDSNNTYHGPWSEKVLGKLLTPFSSNLIGAIMESIWYRRNQIKFNDNTTIITENQIIHKIKKARDAEWDRTRKIVEKQLRQELRCTDNRESINRTASIKRRLEKFSHNWNSKLMTINIPEHFIPYCSYNTNYS
ncbi:hypothetical protein ACTFIT_004930 [Dictyostelium discoideum]